MGSFVVRNALVLVFLFFSFNSFAETNRKSNWRDIGCSKESMDVRPSPNAKKIHLKANLTCRQRARLLGFDKSECDKCTAKSEGQSKKNSPKGGTTGGVSTGAVNGNTDGSVDGTTDGNTDGDTDTTDGGKKNGNNGHGNDPDGNDSSNPGNSNNGDGTDADGSPGNGNGKGKGTEK